LRYRVFDDPFFDKQPALDFADELKAPYHTSAPLGFGASEPCGEHLTLWRVKLCPEFPDKEGLLESAYLDLREFFSSCGILISKDGVPIYTRICDTSCREEYKISVLGDGVYILSADTEGIRRAIYYIEDEMKRYGGPYLPFGEISRKPFIKSRISRCYFAPPSHASNEGKQNELASDIDYYPEEYLNRLAHDGINGLWIGASLHDILPSDVIAEYGADSERRIKKLREITERCKRYGIGIYLLSVEPASGYGNPIFEKHTELHGQRGWGDYHLFCPSTAECMDYIKGAMRRLFSLVPALAGFINISTGEALSACGSAAELVCPRCKKKYGTLAGALAAVEGAFADAIKEVAPEAEFISWTYSQRVWKPEDVSESCMYRPKNVTHMQNFEDFGEVIQLSKKRYAFDYWLSYVGPGEVMERSLKINKERGIKTWAKLQVCSSHEISTVPYVPVPGILYDKYKAMRKEGISGAVTCWYFGNYPCLMGKAASELSFEPFPKSKEEFLLSLAKIYWGADGARVASAWEMFERGYLNYPISQSFEWFGPMQDSPAVPLHLIPADLPMPSSWLTKNMVGGDRIGECLLDGHTLDEAITLCEKMSDDWHRGAEILNTVPTFGKKEREEQGAVAKAIDLLFRSGTNVLKFYRLRHTLGICVDDGIKILDEMRKIAEEEIEISAALARLCESDLRLGFHPEANGYKFFPEKLLWRISELKKMLAEDFSQVERRISLGEAPLAFYAGEGEGKVVREGVLSAFCPEGAYRQSDGKVCLPEAGCVRYGEDSAPEFACQFEAEYFSEPKTSVLYEEDGGKVTLTFTLYDGIGDTLQIKPEFHLFHPSGHIYLEGGVMNIPEQKNYSLLRDALRERRAAITCEYSEQNPEGVSGFSIANTAIYKISFMRDAFSMSEMEPFRLAISRRGRHSEELELADRKFNRLIQGEYSPDSFAIFIK